MNVLFIFFVQYVTGYTAVGRFGHSAIVLNGSIYFYGGDGAINSNSTLSDLAILPIHSSFELTRPPWSSPSGPQDSLGGPSVQAHVAFLGGSNAGNMIIMGGVMPSLMALDEEPKAYSYDIDLGRWNSFTLPRGNRLNRQGAGCTTTGHASFSHAAPFPANMYRFDTVHTENSSLISLNNSPPSRYGHTQTLIEGDRIVILGGFDGQTGNAMSMGDIWVFDSLVFNWTHVSADQDEMPANRNTRTWKWTVKNTNAAVQGRADHTATLVGTNMIVAFGFTGVSTTLTVMSDIEVLDINTWSWTSVYTPTTIQKINKISNDDSSVAIIAGAVTGGVVVFLLVLVILYLLYLQRKPPVEPRDPPNRSDTMVTSKTLVSLPSPWKQVVYKPDETDQDTFDRQEFIQYSGV
ncbi:hypothetical protein G6F56_001352 [Rhizopus delemar]|nr:hypothetical protein G6F56_001352 [Rhizopus delemar]